MKRINEETVRQITCEWAGSVQLTEPRASLLDPDELLEDVAPTFLIEPPPRAERSYNKTHLVAAASESLRRVIKRRFATNDGHMIVQTRHPLSAGVRPRVFDVVIANGSPRHAVQCFNFNVADPKKVLEQQVDSFAFGISDVRRKLRDFPVSVVAARPSQDADGSFEQAASTFKEIDVEFVPEEDVEGMSERIISHLAG